MARMIPAEISPDVKSNAERRVFAWFQNCAGTEEWVVLHSLGIANHDQEMFGEVDFFVLAPRMGIFALEVKGGRVTRQEGVWCYTDRKGETNRKRRGPFEQAQDGVQSIIKLIKSRRDRLHSSLDYVLFGHGVMFPDITFDEQGPDWESWQVFDYRNAGNVESFVRRLFSGYSSKWKSLKGEGSFPGKLPSKQDIDYIVSLLRGDFDKRIALSIRKHYTEERLLALTTEQYRRLDEMEDNPRTVIRGGAGTGKTLLAIEAARRAAASGERVALLCYNRNLGDWLEEQMRAVPAEKRPVFTGTYHRLANDIVAQSDYKDDLRKLDRNDPDYWNRCLPELAAVAVEQSLFDRVIVDEAQDLISQPFLDLLDACTEGGVRRGKWIFFGDFSNQAIYTDLTADDMMGLADEVSSFARGRLTLNCRNTKTIGEVIRDVTDYRPPCDPWILAEGVPVNFIPCADIAAQAVELKKLLKLLRHDGIESKEITILSPHKRANSIVSQMPERDIMNWPGDGQSITFETVHSFKGLENLVIILADIDSYVDKQLMYVALSRARTVLYVLETERAHEEYNKLKLGRMLANG